MQIALVKLGQKERMTMQAVCIIAHKDIAQVMRLADVLLPKFAVYIHFDTKAVLDDEYKATLEKKGIFWFQKINVMWGGWSIAAAVQVLMRAVLKNPDITYIHIISGQCWPAKNVDEIYSFYQDNSQIYMTFTEASKDIKSGECLKNWAKYYYPYDKIQRRSLYGKIFHRINIFVQKILRIDKLKKYDFHLTVYEGAVWMDLPIAAVRYVIDYFDCHKNLQKVFLSGFCPDEFWCQTILCNSPWKDKIVNENHRYVKWQKKYHSYPAILDETDYLEIKKGNFHFIRKIDEQISKGLLELI